MSALKLDRTPAFGDQCPPFYALTEKFLFQSLCHLLCMTEVFYVLNRNRTKVTPLWFWKAKMIRSATKSLTVFAYVFYCTALAGTANCRMTDQLLFHTENPLLVKCQEMEQRSIVSSIQPKLLSLLIQNLDFSPGVSAWSFFVQSQGCGALSTSACPIAHVGLQASKIKFQGTGKQTVGLLSTAMDWRRSLLSFSLLSSHFKTPQRQFISLPFFF